MAFGPRPAIFLSMRILLTGGSGDLGSLLTRDLLAAGHELVSIDMVNPKLEGARFIKASILDRHTMAEAMAGVDAVVHIAAWHGIHEEQGKTPFEFHDLNVTGTFDVLEAAARAGVRKFVFISSTSVDDPYGVYGHTKILNEEMCRAYAARHEMDIIILRPRAFIPSWNRAVYKDFTGWAAWFMKGAVHIDDVEQGVLESLDLLFSGMPLPEKAPVLVLDGAYDYTPDDIANWDKDGPCSSFRKYYAAFEKAAFDAGLDISRPPKILGSDAAEALIGYHPRYSLATLLQELEKYGRAGPPAPDFAR